MDASQWCLACLMLLAVPSSLVAELSSEPLDVNPRVVLPASEDGTLVGLTVRYVETDYLKVNVTIDEYLGVPYAAPPVGDLRFRDPVPYQVEGEYNATYDRAECTQWKLFGDLITDQPDLGREVGEDCLYLSIYTPSPKPTTPVPIFVWIHGGGYNIGGGSEVIYEPLPMVSMADVIVVGVNYRLGVLGYLTTGDDAARGNYGMIDQVVALQWIQDNIAGFGGDPTRVTVGGESAGGSSAHLLMLSPMADGLLHQTIMQSGTMLSPWAQNPVKKAVAAGKEIAEMVGCPTADSTAMMNCMRQKPVANLTSAESTLEYDSDNPVVDGVFFPDEPVALMSRGEMAIMPSLLGFNEDEGTGNTLLTFPEYLLSDVPPVVNLSTYRTMMREYYYNPDATEAEFAAIEQEYVDWSVADNPSGDQIDAFVRMDTDYLFGCPTDYVARALEAAGAPVYRYEMTHDPNWSVYVGIPKWLGATHSEDLQFMFAWGLNPAAVAQLLVDQTPEEKKMSVQWLRYWANFVISGNPNEPLENVEGYPEWPRYTMPEQEYKQLSLNMTNSRALRAKACAFWSKYMPKLRIQTDPIEDVYEDWQEEYGRWRNNDMPAWMAEFEEYKESNSCPTTAP